MKRILRPITAAAVWAGFCGAAAAVPIDFGFPLDFDSGPLAGQMFAGTFTIEGDTFDRTGREIFAPDGSWRSTSGDTLLAFGVTVDGTSFDIDNDNDVQFPEGPIVTFDEGVGVRERLINARFRR